MILLLSYTCIIVAAVIFGGVNAELEPYFAKGKFIKNTEGYQYRYQGQIWHNGIMVSHNALIATLSIIACLFATIGYYGVTKQ